MQARTSTIGPSWCPAFRVPLTAALILACTAAACNSVSTTTTTGPSPVKCQVSATLAAGAIDSSGGTGVVAITTTPECQWTASTPASWISGLSPTTGQGSAELAFRAAANPLASMREAEVVVNDARVLVRQDAAPCRIEIAAPSREVGAAGGSVTTAVTTLGGCTWTVTSEASWITVMSPNPGNGSGNLNLAIAPNSGAERTAAIRIAAETLMITQAAAAACSFSIEPLAQSIAVGGGQGSPIAVSAAPGCAWTAASDVPWITVTTGATGTGSGSVTFSVAANAGSGRTGTLAIAGQTFVVTQAGVVSCSYTISPTSQNVAIAGGPAPPVTVTTASGCAWTAISHVSWVSVTAGATSTGSGSVVYQVSPNTGGTRTGNLTIAGRSFEITQAGVAPCSYSISPGRADVSSDGGTGSPVTLTTAAACTWTVSTEAPWIGITSSREGAGSTTVTYNVGRNNGPERSGTLAIANQTFTVTQGAAPLPGCTYSVAPTSQSVPAAGGAATPIGVTTSSECTWAATSSTTWITITSGASGTGGGSVNFTVAANSGPARVGSLTIAGQSVSVTQAAAVPPPCTYSINPTTQAVPFVGGNGTVTVSTTSGCAWTATSNAPWITVVAGTPGSGAGTVDFGVAANTGEQRSGTMTIAGHTFTVTQAAAPAACTYTLTPTSQSLPATGGTGSFAVATAAGCAWTTTSGAPWIAITSGAQGAGNGTVGFTVAANTGAERVGTLTSGGQTFTVTQAAAPPPPPPCAYTLTPTTLSISAAASSGNTVAVATAGGCGWTATSGAAWLTITAGASGTGGGSVVFSAAANTGPERTGTLTIAGQAFTVTQATGCTYAIAPPSQSIGATGGGASVDVTTAAGCAWTATSTVPWITISSGQSGTSSGSVGLTVAANTGAARSGTVTIAGQTATVNQAAPVSCSYTIQPTSQIVGPGGGDFQVTVSTTPGCSWTAGNNTGWINIISGASGSGPGTVGYRIGDFNGMRRDGSLTVAGQTVTVTQQRN